MAGESLHPKVSRIRDAKGIGGRTGEELVVVLHGYSGSLTGMSPTVELIRDAKPDADIVVPEMPLSLFSFVALEEVVSEVVALIDRQWEQGRARRVTLIGHSMGGLIARKVYVTGCGQNDDAPFEEHLVQACAASGFDPCTSRPWAAHVDRVVLLAALNRGWEVTYHKSRTAFVAWRLLIILGTVAGLVRRGKPLAFAIRRGAPFITQLRLQSMSVARHAASKGCGAALTVQLLGSVDDLVGPDDSIDLASGGDFVYLEVPFSNHRTIKELGDGPGPDEDIRLERRGVVRAAVTEDRDTLLASEWSRRPHDDVNRAVDPDVEKVVFVIHGIRDIGYWTTKVGDRCIQRWKQGGHAHQTMVTETSSYGYFPALWFVFPHRRRAKVAWLMNEYTEAIARFPNADFSYVGHSHGTHLLAEVLRHYPSVHFERVVFAGSVVNTRFPWADYVSSRVSAVVNLVASNDAVVSTFPRGFQMVLGRRSALGGAGHDGFATTAASVHQVRYVDGGHGAAIEEPTWDAISAFVVDGQVPAPGDQSMADVPMRDRHRLRAAVSGWFPPLVWLVVVALLAAVGWVVWWAVPQRFELLWVALYVTGLYLALTRI